VRVDLQHSTARVLVLGEGRDAWGMAAALAAGGNEASVWAPPASSAGVWRERSLRVRRDRYESLLSVAAVTDAFEALDAHGTIFIVSPPSRVLCAAEALLPLIRSDHVVVLAPGYLGSLELAAWLRGRGRTAGELPVFVECSSPPVVVRWLGADSIEVTPPSSQIDAAVFPAARAEDAASVAAVLGIARMHRDVLSASLADPTLQFALARALGGRGPENKSALGLDLIAQARLCDALDRERLSLARSFGLELQSSSEIMLGLADKASLESIAGGWLSMSRPTAAHQGISAAEALCALASWAAFARVHDVPVPVLSACLTILDVIEAGDGDLPCKSSASLGIGRLSEAELRQFLEVGTTD
jgi:hypothetical protein